MGYARTWSLAEPYVIQPKQEQLVGGPVAAVGAGQACL